MQRIEHACALWQGDNDVRLVFPSSSLTAICSDVITVNAATRLLTYNIADRLLQLGVVRSIGLHWLHAVVVGDSWLSQSCVSSNERATVATNRLSYQS